MTPIERTLRDIAFAQKTWKPRLCVDCRHYVTVERDYLDRAAPDGLVKYKQTVCRGQISLVSGERRVFDPYQAREGVLAEDMCGRQGKWFEPKDPTS